MSCKRIRLQAARAGNYFQSSITLKNGEMVNRIQLIFLHSLFSSREVGGKRCHTVVSAWIYYSNAVKRGVFWNLVCYFLLNKPNTRRLRMLIPTHYMYQFRKIHWIEWKRFSAGTINFLQYSFYFHFTSTSTSTFALLNYTLNNLAKLTRFSANHFQLF